MPDGGLFTQDQFDRNTGEVKDKTLPARGAIEVKSPKQAVEQIADDEAQVSMVGMLISQANTGSDVRFEKVAALRRKIEAGTYSVDAEDVAEKLMGEMRKK